jgi:hypothetical protein
MPRKQTTPISDPLNNTETTPQEATNETPTKPKATRKPVVKKVEIVAEVTAAPKKLGAKKVTLMKDVEPTSAVPKTLAQLATEAPEVAENAPTADDIELKITLRSTQKAKPTKAVDPEILSELKEVVGEDIGIAFRSKPTEKPAARTRFDRREKQEPVTQSEVSKPVEKPAQAPRVETRDESGWDEEFPIPLFRAKADVTPTQERQRPTATPREERPKQAPREKFPKPQKNLMPSLEVQEAEPEEASSGNELIEFEPTEVIEIDELTVKMRTRTGAPAKATSATKKISITPREPSKKSVEKVVIPPRALIEIPEDAPQIAMRNGTPTLVRKGRVYPNFWFFGAPQDEERTGIVLDEIRQAAEAGLHVFVLGLDAICDEHHMVALATKSLDMINRIIKIDRDAQVIFHLDLLAAKGWELNFPEAVFRDKGNDLAEPSLADDKYWSFVEKLLVDYTKTLAKSDLTDNILGVEFDRDTWVVPEGQGLDISLASKRKFRDWVRERYHGDLVLLRASWFDGSVNFDDVRIPEIDDRRKNGRIVRAERKERAIIDYHLYLSDQTMTRIGDLAYAVKETSGGNFLVGVRYGLTFQFSHPASGQLSLGKILRTPEIDFISAAPSYSERQPGGVAGFPVPVDSFALNGKLFVSIEDYKTSLSNRPEPDTHNPVMRTPQALESVHHRGFGGGLAHSSGVCWTDQFGNGWLTAASVWQRAKALRETQLLSLGAQIADPEVAVFIDERTLGYLVGSKTFNNLVKSVRDSVSRAGVSVGFYLLSDLTHREKFPECKLHIFINAWDIRPELRAAIKQRLHKDGKILFWVYGAALFDSGRETLERAREVTGIAIKPQPIFSKAGTTILDRRNPISQAFEGGTISADAHAEPSYFAIPEDGTVLGEYTQTGLPSFVMRDIKGETAKQNWTSVFLGEPVINTALIRALAQRAGAHVYSYSEDVVHARAPFLTVHCSGDGQRSITLPGKWSAYNLQTKEWAVIDSTNFRFHSPDGVTHTFLVGPTDQIRQILETDPRELLRMSEIPRRESNIRIDVSNFDVPIVKLDEWGGGEKHGDGDDILEEWFLKPQEEDDYEEDESLAPGTIDRSAGRRRVTRDRDRGRNNRRSRPSFADQVDFDPTGSEKVKEKSNVEIEILFRKRD